MTQALFRAVHVDLDAQEVASVELAFCFRDLAPLISPAPGGEGRRSPENGPPAAQCARGRMFGRKRRDSNRAEQRAAARYCRVTCGLTQRLIQYGGSEAPRPADEAAAPPRARVRQDTQERREQIVTLRGEGKPWHEVTRAVGLSASRVRAIYDEHTEGAPRRLDDDALLTNLRLFLAEVSGEPSRRAYGRWSGRAVTSATIGNRFGSWTRALALARTEASNSRQLSPGSTATGAT